MTELEMLQLGQHEKVYKLLRETLDALRLIVKYKPVAKKCWEIAERTVKKLGD